MTPSYAFPAISLGFTIVCQIFACVTFFFKHRGSHIPSSWMLPDDRFVPPPPSAQPVLIPSDEDLMVKMCSQWSRQYSHLYCLIKTAANRNTVRRKTEQDSSRPRVNGLRSGHFPGLNCSNSKCACEVCLQIVNLFHFVLSFFLSFFLFCSSFLSLRIYLSFIYSLNCAFILFVCWHFIHPLTDITDYLCSYYIYFSIHLFIVYFLFVYLCACLCFRSIIY